MTTLNRLPNPPDEFPFRARHRLRTCTEFAAVFAAKNSAAGECLVVHGLCNQLPHNRLGLSVGRRFAIAAIRVRFKRLCREAFRLTPHLQPVGWDFVVAPRMVRPPKGTKPKPGADRLRRLPWTFEQIRDDLLAQMRRIAKRKPRS